MQRALVSVAFAACLLTAAVHAQSGQALPPGAIGPPREPARLPAAAVELPPVHEPPPAAAGQRSVGGGLPADVEARIDAIFAPFAGSGPGCAVGVVKDGVLVFARGYGMADIAEGRPLTPRSVLPLASGSKQFTAAAVLLAEAEGALSLDDDVRVHVPELHDFGVMITLRHLLHHTSGIRDYVTLWTLSGDEPPDGRTRAGTLALLARQRHLDFPPGTDHLYSNSGYFLLGVALERATGRTLREYADERLFAPLGMEHTRYADDPDEVVSGLASTYERGAGGFERAARRSGPVGAGGLLSTIEDLARWDRAFLGDALRLAPPRDGGSRGRDGAARGASLTAAMVVPGRLAGGQGRGHAPGQGEPLAYAAGLVVGDLDGLTTVSHGGEGGGAGAFLLRFPQVQLGVTCLCNRAGAEPAGLAWRTAIELLYGPYLAETASLQAPSDPPAFVDVEPAALTACAGAWRDPRTRAIWRISPGAGGLLADAGRGAFPLRALGGGRFRQAGHGPRLETAFDGDRLRVEVEAQPPATLERVVLAVPDAAALREYAGRYQSDELGVPWVLEVRDGRLCFAAGADAPREPFEPTVADEFALGPDLRISFGRDGERRIASVSVHTDRVRSLQFTRER